MACYFLVVIFFINVSLGFSDGLLLTDPAHVEQRLNQLESQIQGLSQEVNALEQENTALKAQVSSGKKDKDGWQENRHTERRHLHGLLLTDPAHVEQRFNQLESQIQGLSQEVNTLKQENAALKAQVSSGNSTLVYFSAFLRNTVTPSSVIDVVYDGVRSNYQNCYNATTGRFIAPIKGLYVFAWETVTGPNKIFDTELLVNGERVMLNNCNNLTPSGAYVSCSGTAPTLLKPGDIVHIRVVSGNYLHGGGWSSFSGWLVHRS